MTQIWSKAAQNWTWRHFGYFLYDFQMILTKLQGWNSIIIMKLIEEFLLDWNGTNSLPCQKSTDTSANTANFCLHGSEVTVIPSLC